MKNNVNPCQEDVFPISLYLNYLVINTYLFCGFKTVTKWSCTFYSYNEKAKK